MNEHTLFLQALNLALQLSEVGRVIMEVRYYTGINEVVISFWENKTATVKVGYNLSALDLMQIVTEVIRIETGGSKNEN